MKVVIVGLGSMGKRRIRLIRDMYPDYTIFGVDGRNDRCEECTKRFDIVCFNSLNEIDEDIQAAFICTSPLSHNSLIRESLFRGWHVFTELNLVSDGYEDNCFLAAKRNRILFLSSTFLYREEIKYIQERITTDKQWNYIYHIGQYLPDWHPWENYEDFFLGDKRTNGCREILAIELPWIIKTFGDIEQINASGNKMTELKIDYKDNIYIGLKHKNGNKGCIIADIVSPVAVRKLEVYCEGGYFAWNGTPDELYEYEEDSKKLNKVDLPVKAEHIDNYSSFIVENAYRNEIREFFEVLIKGKKMIYDFMQDKAILDLIDKIGV